MWPVAWVALDDGGVGLDEGFGGEGYGLVVEGKGLGGSAGDFGNVGDLGFESVKVLERLGSDGGRMDMSVVVWLVVKIVVLEKGGLTVGFHTSWLRRCCCIEVPCQTHSSSLRVTESRERSLLRLVPGPASQVRLLGMLWRRLKYEWKFRVL